MTVADRNRKNVQVPIESDFGGIHSARDDSDYICGRKHGQGRLVQAG